MPFSASNSSLSSCSSREFGSYRERYSSRSSTPEREASSRLAAQLERSEYKRSRGKQIRHHHNSPRNIQRRRSKHHVVKDVLKSQEQSQKGQGTTRRVDDQFWQERSRQKAFPFSSDSLTSGSSHLPGDNSRSQSHDTSGTLQDETNTETVTNNKRTESHNSLDCIRSGLQRDERWLEVLYSSLGKTGFSSATTSSAPGNDFFLSRTSLSSRSDGSSEHQGVFSAYDLTQNSPYKTPLPSSKGWYTNPGNTSSLSVNSSFQLTSQNSRDSLLAIDATQSRPTEQFSELTNPVNCSESQECQTTEDNTEYNYFCTRELPYAKHVSTTSYIPHYYSSRFTIRLTNSSEKAEFAQPLESPTAKSVSEMQTSSASSVKEACGFQLTSQGVVQVMRRRNGDVTHTPVHSRTNSLISSTFNETSSTSTLKGNLDQWETQTAGPVSVKNFVKRFSGEYENDVCSDSQNRKVDKVAWQKVRAESWPKYAQMESVDAMPDYSISLPAQDCLPYDKELSEDDEIPPPRPLPPESWPSPGSWASKPDSGKISENASSYGSGSPFKSPQSPISPMDSKIPQTDMASLNAENVTAFPFPTNKLYGFTESTETKIFNNVEVRMRKHSRVESEHSQSSQATKQSPRNGELERNSTSLGSPGKIDEAEGTDSNADCRRSSLGLKELIRLHEEQIAQQTRSASMTWFITSFKKSIDKRQNSQESEGSGRVLSSGEHITVEGKPREISTIEIESGDPLSPNSKKSTTSSNLGQFSVDAIPIGIDEEPQAKKHYFNGVESAVTVFKEIPESKVPEIKSQDPGSLTKKEKQKNRRAKYGRRRMVQERLSSSTDSEAEGRNAQTPRRRRRKIARQKAVCENEDDKIKIQGEIIVEKNKAVVVAHNSAPTENLLDQKEISPKVVDEEIIVAQSTEITSTSIEKIDDNLITPVKELTITDAILPRPVKPITKVTTLPVVYTGQSKAVVYPRPHQAVTKAVPVAQVAPVSSPIPARIESSFASRDSNVGNQSGSAREMYERRLALLNLIPLDVTDRQAQTMQNPEYGIISKESFAQVKEQQYRQEIAQLKREKEELTERSDQERREWKRQLDDQRKLANAYQKLEERYRRRVYELQHALLKCQCPASKILRIQNTPSIISSKSLRSSVNSGNNSGIILGELEQWLSEQSKRVRTNHKSNRESRDSLISSSSDLTGLGWDDSYDMLALAELDLCNGTHV